MQCEVGAGEGQLDDGDHALPEFRNTQGSSSSEDGFKLGQLKVAVVAVNFPREAS